MKNKCNFILVIFITFIFIAPIVFYCYNFKEFAISNNPEHWGVFGDYIGGVYSVILTLSLFYITYLLNKRESGYLKLSSAAKEIYRLIDSINSNKINIQKVNELTKLIDIYEYILPQALYNDLIGISDYYRVVKQHPEQIDVDRENNVKKALKQLV